MSLYDFEENQCVLTTQKVSVCLEFITSSDERHGFQASQLLHYSLTPRESDADQHLEGLTIAFATAEVTLIGSTLARIADHLRDGTLLAVRALPERYAYHIRPKPHVTRINVLPVDIG